MSKRIVLKIVLMLCALLGAGCGGMSYAEWVASLGYPFGDRNGIVAFMDPAPPAHSFGQLTGMGPAVHIDSVIEFSSTAHPGGSYTNEPTTRVAYGQVLGSMIGKKLYAYSSTNQYYIQPLIDMSVIVKKDGTWIVPLHDGRVHMLLTTNTFSPPATTSTLPAVDGISVFALASESLQ